MALDIVFLILALGLILACCIIFVNAIEIFGKMLNLHQGVVGSILAAVGTAMPETIIPVIAVLLAGGPGGAEIGVGAIAGAPFMLGTLAFFVTGAAVLINWRLGRRGIRMNMDIRLLSKDLAFFLVFYGIAVSATFIHDRTAIKAVIAAALCLSYGIYLKWTFEGAHAEMEDVEELYLCRYCGVSTALKWPVVQLVLSLILLVFGAHVFVKYVQALALSLNISPMLLSLIITPVATELPEKVNSIIWIGRKKDTLAMGNITGAMVFQSCFPVVFGMLFTPWDLTGPTRFSALLALASASLVLVWIRVKKSLNPFILMAGGSLYFVFLLYVFL